MIRVLHVQSHTACQYFPSAGFNQVSSMMYVMHPIYFLYSHLTVRS